MRRTAGTVTSKAASLYPEGELGVIDLGSRNFARITQRPHCFMHWHDCPQRPRAWRWFGDCAIEGNSGHKIVHINPLTVEGSLSCEFCSNRGSIVEDEWIAA